VVRGDTTFALLSDSRGKLLIVSRRLRVDSIRQATVHDSLQFAVGTDYGAPAICPEGDDPTETEVRRWNTLDRQIVLKNVMSDEVWLDLRIDHPVCGDRARGAP
jgi:hypothetical protein